MGMVGLEVTKTQLADGTWLIDEPVTGQCGVGATAAEAWDDLEQTLREYLAGLRTRRHQLAPWLREHLAFLEDRMAP